MPTLTVTPRLCTARDFAADWYRSALTLLKEEPILHRKQWEFAAIAQALRERGLLRPGTRGLGFAVGREPLPALFAACGVHVLATDQDTTPEAESLWGADQLCRGAADLDPRGLTSAEDRRRLSYRAVDMRALPEDLAAGAFDFVWSAGSFEHLGGLDAGLDFVVAAMRCLKPGGWAVHTTEYRCGTGMDTLETKHLSLYRRVDVARLAQRLADQGDRLEPVDYDQGDDDADRHVAEGEGLPHLKLRIGPHVTTSILLIAERACESASTATASRPARVRNGASAGTAGT